MIDSTRTQLRIYMEHIQGKNSALNDKHYVHLGVSSNELQKNTVFLEVPVETLIKDMERTPYSLTFKVDAGDLKKAIERAVL